MTDFGPSAKRVLAAYGNAVGPDYSDAAQNWNELVRRIERGEPEMQLVDEPPARGRTRFVVAFACAAVAAVAVLWLGGRATVAALADDDRPSAASWQGGSLVGTHEPASVVEDVVVIEDEPRSRPRASGTSPVTAPDVAVAPPPAFVPPPAPDVRKSKPSKPSTKVAGGSAEDGASTLEQVSVIRKAYAALRAGDGHRALVLLDGHAKRWPTSEFASERDLLRVRALCRVGKTGEAERAAASFGRKHPGSHLGAALDGCAGKEP